MVGCNIFGPDCSMIDPKLPLVHFKVYNEQEILLISPDGKYHPDSISLYTKEDTLELGFDTYHDSTLLYFYYWDHKTNDTYYLKLDNSDIDTIEIISHTEPSECYSYQEIDTFKYNSIAFGAEPGTDIYKVIK